MRFLLWLADLIARFAPPTTRLAQRRAERKTQDCPGDPQLRDILGAWGLEVVPTILKSNNTPVMEHELMGAVRQLVLCGWTVWVANPPYLLASRLYIRKGELFCVVDIKEPAPVDRLVAAISEVTQLHEMSLGVAG